MSFRQFEEVNHALLYRKYRNRPPILLIERIIKFLREKYTGSLTEAVAVDVGCGTGQCTILLARYFGKVLGTDISEAQINEALQEKIEERCENVQFCVSPAEKIELPDQSVQLITACTAAHWFDLDKLYEEGRRVLVPGGVMAFFCYGPDDLIIMMGDDTERNREFEILMRDVFTICKPHFASPVALVQNKYKDIIIPYNNLTREYDYETEKITNLSMILGSIRSFSGFQTLCKVKGVEEGEKLMETFKTRYLEIAGLSNDPDALNKNVFTIKHRYFLVMARI